VVGISNRPWQREKMAVLDVEGGSKPRLGFSLEHPPLGPLAHCKVPAPTSLPCDGGGVDVEPGEFTHFLFCQCTRICLVYPQFLVIKKKK
jgi:hypothetical protein